MKIYYEKRLRDFEFWSGAKETASILKAREFDDIEEYIEEMYPDGIDERVLNDFFWFDDEWIAIFLGYENFGQMLEERRDHFKSRYD